jgi:hypothetical protein
MWLKTRDPSLHSGEKYGTFAHFDTVSRAGKEPMVRLNDSAFMNNQSTSLLGD